MVSVEYREKLSASQVKRLQDNPEEKEARALRAKEKWKDPEYRKRVMENSKKNRTPESEAIRISKLKETVRPRNLKKAQL